MICNISTPMLANELENDLENAMEVNSPESDCIDVVNEDLNTSEKLQETTIGMDSSYEQLPAKKRKTNKHDAISDLLNIERQKLLHFTKINENSQKKKSIIEDESFHFMVSLVPYLQELPENRKLIVRHKLQQVFLEEQERCDTNRLNQNDLNLSFLQPLRSEESRQVINQAYSNIPNDSNQCVTSYIQQPNQTFATTSSTYY
ncbi:uncharacterized protein LOC132948115 [Metopolophium dirhodum]|uniref:uncharacterized protein LOC132948115 n=1 Tax=Metopolophium dirhodum TaxID=44670 RepID=UPI0029906050|nr:uncharacterized protein LOC132948115 [Metopolophium dirhodum]